MERRTSLNVTIYFIRIELVFYRSEMLAAQDLSSEITSYLLV